MRTLLELIKADWHAAGGKGPLTKEFIARWAVANPSYCKRDGSLWPLWTRYHSGSALPILGETTMSRIMSAWLAAGHPGPGKPGFGWDDFQAFADSYTDEFLELQDGPEVIALTGEGKAIVR